MSLPRHLRRSSITPVETRFRHTVHTYHGVNPWNRQGTRLLYLGFDALDRGCIVVQDLITQRETVLAETDFLDYHTAAKQRWILDDTAVVFATHGTGGEQCPAVVWLDRPGEIKLLSRLAGRGIRQICGDGRHAFGSAEEAGHASAAIERIDLLTEESEMLLTTAEALAVLPEELRDTEASYFFNHSVFNDAESRLFFKLMQSTPRKGTQFCAFYVMDVPSQEVRCFGNRVSGHPHWMPDGRHILNVKSPRDGSDNRWLVLVDSETGADERLIDLPIEGPGHPSPSPDGRWIVTDAFTRDGTQSPIYVIDRQTGAAREIARLPHHFQGGRPYDPSAITRGQPHPVWSPDGHGVLVNCNHGGERMRLLLLHDFFVGPDS
jgi:hypothetical protein